MIGDYHDGKKKTMRRSGDGKEKDKQVRALCGRAVLVVGLKKVKGESQ